MTAEYFVVRFTGPFGFIKPWTAVRDEETISQPFLTPSIIEGMRQKLEVSSVLRHRLQHQGISVQQERAQPGGWEVVRGVAFRRRSIVRRGIMLNPKLYLAFGNLDDANRAAAQHLCLCRNEDIVLPAGEPTPMSGEEFGNIPGFELIHGEGPSAFPVGFDRFAEGHPMYGTLIVTGDPLFVEDAQ